MATTRLDASPPWRAVMEAFEASCVAAPALAAALLTVPVIRSIAPGVSCKLPACCSVQPERSRFPGGSLGRRRGHRVDPRSHSPYERAQAGEHSTQRAL